MGRNLYQPRFFRGASFFGRDHPRDLRSRIRRCACGAARRDPRAREAEGSTRVKEAKINCNLIRGSKPGPIAIRCTSAGREEWRRALRHGRVAHLPPPRPCGKCWRRVKSASFKTRRRGNARIYDVNRSGSMVTMCAVIGCPLRESSRWELNSFVSKFRHYFGRLYNATISNSILTNGHAGDFFKRHIVAVHAVSKPHVDSIRSWNIVARK